jgi:catechol 2,3-dioxygenase-like lactoylglutathione lyase family enzyme
MFNQSRVAAMLPAQDLNRAKAFYRDKLGLTPTQEMGDDLVFYMMGGGTGFLVYRSEGKAPGSYTQLFVEVPDVEQAVKDLKGRGVKLEEYDSPGQPWAQDQRWDRRHRRVESRLAQGLRRQPDRPRSTGSRRRRGARLS